MITSHTVMVNLCDTCGLTHQDMMIIRVHTIEVFNSPANRRGQANYTDVCATLAIAVAFGGVQPALELPATKIIHRAKKPDVKALCNG